MHVTSTEGRQLNPRHPGLMSQRWPAALGEEVGITPSQPLWPEVLFLSEIAVSESGNRDLRLLLLEESA